MKHIKIGGLQAGKTAAASTLLSMALQQDPDLFERHMPKEKRPCLYCGQVKQHNNAFCSKECLVKHKNREATIANLNWYTLPARPHLFKDGDKVWFEDWDGYIYEGIYEGFECHKNKRGRYPWYIAKREVV